VSNATPNVGDPITFTVTLSDQGPDAATNVQVTDLLPAGLTFVSATPSQGTYTSGSGMWTVGTVSTGVPQTLNITALVVSPGTQTNTTAMSHADQFDPNTANNSATATETPQVADLAVTVTDGKDTVVPGTGDTYTIVVANNGPGTVSSVNLIDAIPGALLNATFGPASQGSYNSATGEWSGLSLPSGQSVFIALSGWTAPDATGTLSNTVTVSPPAGVTDTNPVNNVATDTDTLALVSLLNPSPPPAISANMVLRHSAGGQYEIYNLGSNTILAAS
jgi:uncharacterized repeat protein (TIGR01451 family)